MPTTSNINEKMYHIGLSKADIKCAKYALLPGDPGRVTQIAAFLGEYTELNFNREYKSALAKVGEDYVLVCSTGMGGPSMAIGIEELATIGITKIIRVGTTGAIQTGINIGDIIINSASVRLDGTSTHYAPIEYPAVADLNLTYALANMAKQANIKYHVGIAVSSDTFWPGQERYTGFNEYVPNRFKGSMQEWRSLNALNYEMETAALFTVASVFKLQAAAVCLTVANRNESEQVLDKDQWPNMSNKLYEFLARCVHELLANNI